MKYLLPLLVLTFATVANAQSFLYPPPPKAGTTVLCRDKSLPTPILLKNSYKIKAVTGVSSETARVGDYVEFTTMEPLYTDEAVPDAVFDKGTAIYGVVTRRNHRHFPLVRGKLEIALEPLFTWDDKPIQMAIARYGKLKERETGRLTQKELASRNKGINKDCKVNKYNCVAGRGNATVSVVVTAIAGASGAAVSSISDDDDTKFIAATSFFSIAKDLGNLLNGTDVGIGKDEIFNLTLKSDSAVCKIPKPKTPSTKNKAVIPNVIKPWGSSEKK